VSHVVSGVTVTYCYKKRVVYFSSYQKNLESAYTCNELLVPSSKFDLDSRNS